MIIEGVFFIPWALKPENLRETKNKINSILYNSQEPNVTSQGSYLLLKKPIVFKEVSLLFLKE